MSLHDVVHQIVLEKGPMLPAEIVRDVNARTGKTTDMFFVGAILSELMSAKQIKMSYAKIGGSRVYYCKGQESKLTKLYEYLPEKYKKAYDILQEQKIVRSKELEPVIRAAMSDLKDFAVPLTVKLKEEETFFKWYMMPMEEAQALVKQQLQQEIDAFKKESEQAKNPQPVVEKKDPVQQTASQQPQPKPQQEQQRSNSQNEFILSGSQQKSEPAKAAPGQTQQPPKKEVPVKEKSSETQAKLSESDDVEDPFVQKVMNFFQKNNISIKEVSLLRKDSEAEFEGTINSQIGQIYYYFFAKSKKKISETDLSYAYVRAQNRNLPLCYLSPGDLTKKAEESLETDLKAANFLKL